MNSSVYMDWIYKQINTNAIIACSDLYYTPVDYNTCPNLAAMWSKSSRLQNKSQTE